MAGTFLDSLTEQYNTLTRSGKKLANYIFSHASETQYLSISALAENCGVSEASITRFCRSLGLSGYNELKLSLAKSMYTNEFGDCLDAPQTVTPQDTPDTTRKKLHDAYIISLNETMEQLNDYDLDRAVDILYNAKNVYCFGQGGSMVMAMEAWARFTTITPKFVHISDSHLQVMTTSLCTKDEAILFFSYSGTTREVVEILHLAKEHNVPIILVTHFAKSEAAALADVVLLCGYNENPLQGGSIATKMGLLFIIDCLYYGYCRRRSDLYSSARTTTAQALSRNLP